MRAERGTGRLVPGSAKWQKGVDVRGRSPRVVLLAVLVALLGVAVFAVSSASKSKPPKRASAALVDTSGKVVGKVAFEQGKNGKVTVTVRAGSLSPGFHGFHVHTTGRCDASTAFMSAGVHWNPTAADHGSHVGDMPPLLVGKDGKARAKFESDRFKVAELLDSDGSAVIVHADPDNLANIPSRYSSAGPDAMTRATGDSGARKLCGVVTRSKQ